VNLTQNLGSRSHPRGIYPGESELQQGFADGELRIDAQGATGLKGALVVTGAGALPAAA